MKTAATKQAVPLAVIDQARIPARTLQQWAAWVPGYVTVQFQGDWIVVLGITGTADPMPEGRHPNEIVRREQELGFLGWFGEHRRELEAGIVEEPGDPCQCWTGPCWIHDRHCCFRTATICHKIPERCPA